MKIKPTDEITAFLSPIAKETGVSLVETEFKQGKNPTLTLYIDKAGGVDLDTCAAFHNAVDAPLDAFDPTFGQPYTLNVSSLGIDRPFKTEEDFTSRIGKRVEVRLKNSVKGKKFFDGILLSYDGKTETVRINEKDTLTFDLKNVEKTNDYVDFDYDE